MIDNRSTALIATFIVSYVVIAFGADDEAVSRSDRIAKLNAARPLNHHVNVTRTGSVLKLEYQLIGSDGKKHSLWDINDQSKPKFAISNNGRLIGNGAFEFG